MSLLFCAGSHVHRFKPPVCVRSSLGIQAQILADVTSISPAEVGPGRHFFFFLGPTRRFIRCPYQPMRAGHLSVISNFNLEEQFLAAGLVFSMFWLSTSLRRFTNHIMIFLLVVSQQTVRYYFGYMPPLNVL